MNPLPLVLLRIPIGKHTFEVRADGEPTRMELYFFRRHLEVMFEALDPPCSPVVEPPAVMVPPWELGGIP